MSRLTCSGSAAPHRIGKAEQLQLAADLLHDLVDLRGEIDDELGRDIPFIVAAKAAMMLRGFHGITIVAIKRGDLACSPLSCCTSRWFCFEKVSDAVSVTLPVTLTLPVASARLIPTSLR